MVGAGIGKDRSKCFAVWGGGFVCPEVFVVVNVPTLGLQAVIQGCLYTVVL